MYITQHPIHAPDITKKITAARLAKKMTKAQCARIIGISRMFWGELENGDKNTISIDRVRQIEALLDVKLMP
jgi:transcriptional regulator with XRE-family HTH domain